VKDRISATHLINVFVNITSIRGKPEKVIFNFKNSFFLNMISEIRIDTFIL